MQSNDPDQPAQHARKAGDAASGVASGYRRIAVYPGSFDPVTQGHLDIAAHAARLVDELVVAVYATPNKNLLFSTEERVELWRDAIDEAHLVNVRVSPYEGLTTEFARSVAAQAIIRGLRAVSDFEVEFQQALMYRELAPEIETLMIVTSLRHVFVSSSLIKEVWKLGGELEDLVTPRVAHALREKFAR